MFSLKISTIKWWKQKVTKPRKPVMIMMELYPVEKEALMTYNTHKGLKHSKFMAHGDSDCEEYLECQESSESDLEG
nr:hypothetical protein CFP56_35021 [Quercus suber]